MSSLKAKEKGYDVKVSDQQKRTAEGDPAENCGEWSGYHWILLQRTAENGVGTTEIAQASSALATVPEAWCGGVRGATAHPAAVPGLGAHQATSAFSSPGSVHGQ